MTPDEVLALARAGDLGKRGENRAGVADVIRALSTAGQAASALEIAGRVWRVWFTRGELEQGSAVLAKALSTKGAATVSVWYARALIADGALAFRLGDQLRALSNNEQALEAARADGDVQGECDALTGLARVALREARYDDVVRLARDARAKAREVGSAEA